jgi:hypothetical protein
MNTSTEPTVQQAQLYLMGHLLAEAVALSEKLSHSSPLQNAYRYSKIVDYSSKGFDCSQAAALMMVHNAEIAKNPDLQRDINQLLEISSKIKAILLRM